MRNTNNFVDDEANPLARKSERERRRQLMNEIFEDIRATRSGFKASDNVSREALYERCAVR